MTIPEIMDAVAGSGDLGALQQLLVAATENPAEFREALEADLERALRAFDRAIRSATWDIGRMCEQNGKAVKWNRGGNSGKMLGYEEVLATMDRFGLRSAMVQRVLEKAEDLLKHEHDDPYEETDPWGNPVRDLEEELDDFRYGVPAWLKEAAGLALRSPEGPITWGGSPFYESMLAMFAVDPASAGPQGDTPAWRPS